jgi:hypothetical protein
MALLVDDDLLLDRDKPERAVTTPEKLLARRK